MTTRKAHKITGILAAALAVSALGTLPVGATAQTTTTTPPASQQPVPTLPSTTPPDTTKTPGQVQTPPATGDASTATSTATAAQGTGPVAKDFIQTAFLSNEFGIAAAQVALKTSSNTAVKAAAQSVLTDGLKVRQDMVTAIQGATTDMHFDQSWTDDYKQKLADLQSVTGKDFDQKYLATQGDITKTAVGAYNDYATAGTDATVKTFAQSTLPRLQADSGKIDAAAGSVAAEPDTAAAPGAPAKSAKTVKHTKKK